MADSVEKVGVLTRPNFFSAVSAVFRFGRGGAPSSTSDSTERVLNRSAAVINVNRRCRWYFSRFATTIDLRLFQQNRPLANDGEVGHYCYESRFVGLRKETLDSQIGFVVEIGWFRVFEGPVAQCEKRTINVEIFVQAWRGH